MNDNNKRFEELRLEFLKRANLDDALRRAELSMELSQEPALTIHPASHLTFGPQHGYTMEITFNLYKTEKEILDAFRVEVLEGRIRWNKKIMEEYDDPESKKPIFQKGKGKKEPTTLKEIEECLIVYDLFAEGLSEDAIIGKVFNNYKKTNKMAWISDRKKIKYKLEKALVLIESVKNNTFPKYT